MQGTTLTRGIRHRRMLSKEKKRFSSVRSAEHPRMSRPVVRRLAVRWEERTQAAVFFLPRQLSKMLRTRVERPRLPLRGNVVRRESSVISAEACVRA